MEPTKRKNLSALRWLEANFPEVYNMYKEYEEERRLTRARIYDQKKRAQARLEKITQQ